MTTICRFPRPGRSAPADLTELPSYDETYVTAMPGDNSLILSDARAQGTRPVRTAVSSSASRSAASPTDPEVHFAREDSDREA